jgi:glutamate/tyrosine decarboxylase-like PLP-dependent enzyme
MSFTPSEFDAPLDRAAIHAREWLATMADRKVPPAADIDVILADARGGLPTEGLAADAVIDEMSAIAEPGLMAMGSGRFFGWVIGGTLPAALAADWLVSAWDQNAALRFATPGVVALEEIAAGWLLDLLGLPATCDVGFVTGATMANFTGLAAGRQHVLGSFGWDLDRDGLAGGPRINVLVGDDGHATVDLALRYLGLGAATRVPADEQGRIRPDALATALERADGPTIVALQAGNLHSGAFDPLGECIDLAHARNAWVHVDGAFGLWAAASPSLRHLMAGCERADSWATDAHKTLNAPYDCGVAIVRHPQSVRDALGTTASYLVQSTGHADPFQNAPEFSRRARGVPVWAALRSLGRVGVADLVDRLAAHARALAEGIAAVPGARILNDVAYTQVSVAFESDERTRAVTTRLLADGTAWMSGSRWRGQDVLRVSVSNWSTDEADVAASIEAVRRAAAATGGGEPAGPGAA